MKPRFKRNPYLREWIFQKYWIFALFLTKFGGFSGVFWSILHAETANFVVLKKTWLFLMWNVVFLPIWFSSISPSNTSGRKILPFCRSYLILAIKLELRKPPFKRNPYLREKFGLTDFSLKSRFHCIIWQVTLFYSFET